MNALQPVGPTDDPTQSILPSATQAVECTSCGPQRRCRRARGTSAHSLVLALLAGRARGKMQVGARGPAQAHPATASSPVNLLPGYHILQMLNLPLQFPGLG